MKLRNKILSAIMMVAASVSLVSVSAFAASVSFDPASVEVKAGETFTVDVVTADNSGVCALGFVVTGTNDTFTLTNVEDSALYANATHGNNYAKAEYGLAWWIDDMFETESTESGKAVTLTYKVNDDVTEGDYTITIANDENTSMNIDGDVVDFGTATLNVKVVSDAPATKEVGFETTLKYDGVSKGFQFVATNTETGATATSEIKALPTVENLGDVKLGCNIVNVPEAEVETVKSVVSMFARWVAELN